VDLPHSLGWQYLAGGTRITEQLLIENLTRAEQFVLQHKGTEPANTGRFTDHEATGTYHCRACDAALYRSTDKFHSGCGWPSFDDEIADAVRHARDADGHRTEILCATCDGHLGHVFAGERLTEKNTRHCVNSISLRFESDPTEHATAWFAGGCFWGVEYHFERAPGVLKVSSGYMGGHVEQPDYRQVCDGVTGHAEAVQVQFNPARTDFETLAKLFFEIHDPTEVDRQGPDIGTQYRSAIYFADEAQRQTAERLINQLRDQGLNVVTELTPVAKFWPAEDYHQEYYARHAKQPYCHTYTKRFQQSGEEG